MPVSLSKAHRKLLENTTKAARVLAESACRAALENLAVHEKDYRAHMSVEQRLLRNRLRARGRAIGDVRDVRTGTQDIRHLSEHTAYEHWHRLLFTRFLTENHLLFTDEANGHVPVTLDECEELAPELGARDGLDLACRFASLTLPGVFRHDDPVLDLPIALNDQVELRKLLVQLPSECFLADDALGWTYQFWQAQRKDEVNASGKKIGADELAPVTQLFTEDYMVEFLLHNTLGAWWAGKIGPIQADSEEEARSRAVLPARGGVPAISWTYLRFVQDEATQTWLPVAGPFEGWPKSARLIRLLDPCMGSGHFLVFALPLLARLRVEEEKLDARAAVFSVLKNNIHGLELDERCTQIAAFNMALTSWKLAGYQALPSLNLACSGVAPGAGEMEWRALAGENDRLQRGMTRLHSLFRDAPVLGSLINPRSLSGDLIEADFHELAPLLIAVLPSTRNQTDKNETDAVEQTVVAQGIAKAADLLVGQYTLVITNVPYLGRAKQDDDLKEYCERAHPKAKADLATCFVERCLGFCHRGASTALVTPQNWLFLGRYTPFRQQLLGQITWNAVARLGSHAFESIGGEVVNVALLTLTQNGAAPAHVFAGQEVSAAPTAAEKAVALTTEPIFLASQRTQLANPDSKIITETSALPLIREVVATAGGMCTFDSHRFYVRFWERAVLAEGWEPLQTTVDAVNLFEGRHLLVRWENGTGDLFELVARMRDGGYTSGIWCAGRQVWGSRGVLVSLMGDLRATLYEGVAFDNNCAVLVPLAPSDLPALWAYCSSSKFRQDVRKIDQKLNVTSSTLGKVPFDLSYWQRVAAENYPEGLPMPHSDDATQWLFDGRPQGSSQPLQVAVARLLGYCWPRQTSSTFCDCPALRPDGLERFADEDGIVCIPAINREQPAAVRLRQLLSASLGTFDERTLVAAAGPKGSKSRTIEEWLRVEFFEQHTSLFHDRPFLWHLWDGRPDGFHALVNYHKLDHVTLQKLTYSYLGNWIQQQTEDANADKPGAAGRLGAARNLQSKLAGILEGEAPLDIFVRWKALKNQGQGWHPDFNDGVRQNIRPFLLAGDVGKKGIVDPDNWTVERGQIRWIMTG